MALWITWKAWFVLPEPVAPRMSAWRKRSLSENSSLVTLASAYAALSEVSPKPAVVEMLSR
jgi:hypothetical protein